MCGITGVFRRDGIPLDRYAAAHATLRHRGPDDEGFVGGSRQGPARRFSGEHTRGRWAADPPLESASEPLRWAIGHHRLSIIDLSEAGHQPMTVAEGRHWLSYNGEIYNYVELRSELERDGVVFQTATDTEVVLQAYRQWGEGCFSRFNGMWALALFDCERQRLVLCRDRFGIKPLYYRHDHAGLVFASEAKALAAFGETSINHQLAAEYLAYCHLDHREETLYQEVSQLLPGHYAVFDADANRLTTHRYWSLEVDATPISGDIRDAAAQFEALFSSALDLRMRADVPVGSLLSGGLDSNAVVGNLSHRERFGDGGFHTFTADFKDPEFSERCYVEQTVERCPSLRPHFIYPDPDQLEHEIAGLLETQDFPFRSLAVYSQNLIYRHVREESDVVVLLNGQGADELFGGYTNHYRARLASDLMHGRIRGAFGLARWLSKHRGLSLPRLMIGAARHAVRAFVPPAAPGVVGNRHFSTAFRAALPRQHRDPFENLLRTNLCVTALPEYLRYEDRNSMAHSLESRLPFLDYRLVEWAFTLPHEFKLHRGENKRVVREAVRPYVPAPIVDRRDKMGFVSPQERWQHDQLKGWLDRAVADIEVPFLDKNQLLYKYRTYQREGCGDWAFWWRIACLHHWSP